MQLGVLTTGVAGRTGQVLSTSGMRTFVNTTASSGSWKSDPTTKSLLVPIPTTAAKGDSLLACVIVDNVSTSLYQTAPDPKDQWTFLGSIADAPYQMFLYYKDRWNSSNPYLTLTSDVAVKLIDYDRLPGVATPTGVMDVRIAKTDLSIETGTGLTAHTMQAVCSVGWVSGDVLGSELISRHSHRDRYRTNAFRYTGAERGSSYRGNQ